MQKLSLSVILITFGVYFLDVNAQSSRVGIAQGSSIITEAPTMNKILDGMIAVGSGYTRIDLDWRWIQPNNSRSYNWEVAEPAIKAAISKGLKVIALPTYSPGWANGNTGNMQSPPLNDTYFYNLCYEAGLHYIPLGVTDWELWNEANGGGMTDSIYVKRILKPGYNALHAAANALNIDPNTLNIITSGPQPAASDGKMTYSQVDWVKGIYRHGGKNYFNNVGQHPYCWPFDPYTESQYNWFKKTPELYTVMSNNGDSNKKIWVTEMGWPTHTKANGDDRGISEANQALFLQKAYNMWNSWSWSGPFLVYNYWPERIDAGDPEQNFGMVRTDFSPKPSLQAIKDMFAGKVWAEACALSGSAAVGTTGSGWSGTGYVRNLTGSVGSSLTMNVYVSSSGNYNVTFRYSNGNTASKTLSVYINNASPTKVNFNRTGSWDTSWGTVTSLFTLKAGVNAIKIQYNSVDGRVDLDYLAVSNLKSGPSARIDEMEIEKSKEKTISCYPNNFSETAQLQIDVSTNDEYSINIYNTSGQIKEILLKKSLSVGRHYITFGDNLEPGIYQLELRSSKIHETIRVIKD